MTVDNVQSPPLQRTTANKPLSGRNGSSGDAFENALRGENQVRSGEKTGSHRGSDVSAAHEFERISMRKPGSREQPVDSTPGDRDESENGSDVTGRSHQLSANGKPRLPLPRGETETECAECTMTQDSLEPDETHDGKEDGSTIANWLGTLQPMAGGPANAMPAHVSEDGFPMTQIPADRLPATQVALENVAEKRPAQAANPTVLTTKNTTAAISVLPLDASRTRTELPVEKSRTIPGSLASADPNVARAPLANRTPPVPGPLAGAGPDVPPTIGTDRKQAFRNSSAGADPGFQRGGSALDNSAIPANFSNTASVPEGASVSPAPAQPNGAGVSADAKPGPATNSFLAQLDRVHNMRELLATDRTSFTSRLNQDGGTVQVLRLQLRPAELGNVTANVKLENGQLTIELIAEKDVAFRQLAKDASVLQSAMRSIGVVVDELVVSHGNANAQADQLMQEQNRGAAQDRENTDGRSSTGRRSAGEDNAHDPGHKNVEDETNRTYSGLYI